MAADLPPYAALLSHTVEDVDTWKVGFDSHEPARVAAGMLGHHLNRAEDDPNRITIFLALSDLDKAKTFASSPDLADTMKRFGVISPPETIWLQPIREDVVWDRQLPAMIVDHRVADVDAWLEVYDSVGDMQKAGGIIGQAANRSLDDPQRVIVYHQAESFDTLRAFLANPDLEQAMKEAGVVSAPEVSFQTGGWAKFY
jgi:hypothetical protein